MSATSRDQTITLSSGRKLGFDEYGDPDGTPLFYYHGWPSARTQGCLLDEVAKKYRLRVIAPDRPGIGLSDYQPNRQLLDWPPVLKELAAHLGVDKFYVLGVSGGGPYALATAWAMPERILGVTVCCGAPPLRTLGTDGLIWTYKLGLWAWRWMPWALAPGFMVARWCLDRQPSQWPLTWLFAAMSAGDRAVLQDKRNFEAVCGGGLICLGSGARAVITDAEVYISEWGFDLREIKIPVHFWHGTADNNIPLSFAQRTAAQVHTAITTWTLNDGHYSLPLLRSEEMVAAMLV